MTALTFATLDAGRKWAPPSGDSPLELWYVSVLKTPLTQLRDADLARALRQNIHPAAVVPVALDRLARDPDAGDRHRGELAAGLGSLPESFWRDHRALAKRAVTITPALDGLPAAPRQQITGWMQTVRRLNAGQPRLVLVEPAAEKLTLDLSVVDDTTAGTGEDATMMLPESTETPAHALRFIPGDDGFLLRAQARFVELNDRRVVDDAKLVPGDRIKVGKAVLRFEVQK